MDLSKNFRKKLKIHKIFIHIHKKENCHKPEEFKNRENLFI